MRTVRRRLLGAALVLVFGLVGLMAIATGVTLDGKEAPAMQCSSGIGLRPSVGGPYYEQTKVTGERTWFPFGMACTYDAPDDGVGPQTVITAHWVPTIIWIGSSIVVVLGLVLLVRPDIIAGRKNPQPVKAPFSAESDFLIDRPEVPNDVPLLAQQQPSLPGARPLVPPPLSVINEVREGES